MARLASFAGLVRRGLLARPGLVAAGLGVTAASAAASLSEPSREPWQSGSPSLPTFSQAEVSKHASDESGIWVTFGEGVYDITSFIQNHPGGREKIMLAAGGSVERFWSLYRQHVQPDEAGGVTMPKEHVAEILSPLQIGWLDPADVAAAKLAAAARDANDPYALEPARHPALTMLSSTPCSAETPAALMGDDWLTPNELFFVRNHHPVPDMDEGAYRLEVSGVGMEGRSFGLEQLRALPQKTVVATLQCGGNRRSGLDEVRKTSGNSWGIGAMSNAEWRGPLLRDVLAASGLDTSSPGACRHVQFEGEDGTKASVPVVKAISAEGDTLLALEMNGAPLPRDHGAPVRVVVPGHVGVRNIKWLTKVTAAEEEADGVWQRGMAYKSFGPSVTSLKEVDIAAYAPMQEMPVTSMILSPSPGAAVDADGDVTVRGIAWSGGGRGIIRVDVSADGGETWRAAELGQGSEQPLHKAWAWTFWEAEVPAPSGGERTTLICKAFDAAHNTQPETAASIWNLRGLANNSWHRVRVALVQDTD